MSIRIDDALGVHERALGLRMQRSEILAANLANEDTPGFQARDIDFNKEMSRLQSSTSPRASIAGTDPRLLFRVPGQQGKRKSRFRLLPHRIAAAYHQHPITSRCHRAGKARGRTTSACDARGTGGAPGLARHAATL